MKTHGFIRRTFYVALATLTTAGLLAIRVSVAHADLAAPSWWNNTTCDTAHYTGAYSLGTSYNGVTACGPRPIGDNGTDLMVHFFSGAWGENEWECVELVMRYMYPAYGINPYNAPGGKDVVGNYSGTKLTNVSNNGTSLPSPGDILSESATPTNAYGHTAVVTAVNVTNGSGTVSVLQQNMSADGSGSITVSNGILGSNVSGWLHNSNGSGGHLTQMNNSGSGWGTYDVSSGYQTKGTPFTLWGSGMLDMFAIDSNGGLDQYHQDTTTGTWTVYQDVVPASYNLAGGVTGVLDGTTLNLFTTNSSGKLLQIQKPQSSSWAVYTILGSSSYTITGRPAVLWTSGSVSVFTADTAGDLLQYYVVQGQTNWTIYNVQSSVGLTGGVTTYLYGATTNVFGTNTSHHLIQFMGNGGWGANDLTQAAGATIGVTSTPGLIWGASTIDIFPEGTDHSLQQYHLNISSGPWTHYDNVRPVSSNLSGGTDASMWGSTTEVFATTQ